MASPRDSKIGPPGVRLSRAGLILGRGKPLPLWSGTAHYWRLDPARWGTVLDRLVDLGLGIVETYVPWGIHERRAGSFDWGEEDPRLDLRRFLDLAQARGLKVILRPGPHINAELTEFGFPARVLGDARVQARTAWGTPAYLPAPPRMFPLPSYASEEFYRELAPWFDAFADAVRTRIWPRGPLVALQADNEMSFFFRTDPFDLDYAPGALEGWRRFALAEYGTLDRVNRVHGTRWSSIEAIDPPRRHDPDGSIERELDWVRFKERLLVEGLRRIRRMLEERGLIGVAWTHNYPGGAQQVPFHLPAVEREAVDVQGVDLYLFAREAPYLKRTAAYLAGTSRYPYAPEFGAGCALWLKPLTVEDHRLITPSLFMHGVRGANFYMAVERERWFGSPIRSDGSLDPEGFAFHREWIETLKAIRFWELERRADVLLLLSRRALRLQGVLQAFSPLPPLLFDALGWGAEETCLEEGGALPLPIEHERWWKGWADLLERERIPYDLGDVEGDPALWRRYRWLVVPAFQDAEVEGVRRRLGEGRGAPHLVVTRTPPHGEGWRREPGARNLFRLQAVGRGPWEAAWFEGRGRSVLFLANPTPAPVQAPVTPSLRLREVPEGRLLRGRVPLAPATVRVFQVLGGKRS